MGDTYSILSGMVMLIVFIAANVGANGLAGLDGVAGLLQRISIVIGLAWLLLLASRFLRRPANVAGSQRRVSAAG